MWWKVLGSGWVVEGEGMKGGREGTCFHYFKWLKVSNHHHHCQLIAIASIASSASVMSMNCHAYTAKVSTVLATFSRCNVTYLRVSLTVKLCCSLLNAAHTLRRRIALYVHWQSVWNTLKCVIEQYFTVDVHRSTPPHALLRTCQVVSQ